MNEKIVGVRFKDIGKVYHFNAIDLDDVEKDDYVIVRTSRGKQLGKVINFVSNPGEPKRGSWKKLIRKASASDMVIRQQRIHQEKKITDLTIKLARKFKLDEVKIVDTEINFEGDSISIMFNIDGDKDVDFKILKREISKEYRNYKIDFRRLGPRDVAKIIGGMGACGIEKRCCSMFLSDFNPISIKMAKAQSVSLDPTEITGMCGRLRCCLIFEYENYVEARKNLPKRKKKVVTPQGVGIVLDVRPLAGEVVVKLQDETRKIVTFDREDVEPWKELEVLKKKSQQPCDHANGKCHCGKLKKKG